MHLSIGARRQRGSNGIIIFMLKEIKLSSYAQEVFDKVESAEKKGCDELHRYIRNRQVNLATFSRDFLAKDELIFLNGIKNKLEQNEILTVTEKIILALEFEKKFVYKEVNIN